MNAYELAKELGISHDTVYKWVQNKNCPHTTEDIGLRTVMRFDLEEVKAWIEEQKKHSRK